MMIVRPMMVVRLSGHGTKSSILYLHSLGVWPIVRPSGHPLIQDSLTYVYKKVSGSSVAFLILYVNNIPLMGNDL